MFMRERAQRFNHRQQRVRIVAVIDHHRGALDLQHVEPARNLVGVGRDGFGSGTDHYPTKIPSDHAAAIARQGVFHLERNLAVCASMAGDRAK